MTVPNGDVGGVSQLHPVQFTKYEQQVPQLYLMKTGKLHLVQGVLTGQKSKAVRSFGDLAAFVLYGLHTRCTSSDEMEF